MALKPFVSKLTSLDVASTQQLSADQRPVRGASDVYQLNRRTQSYHQYKQTLQTLVKHIPLPTEKSQAHYTGYDTKLIKTIISGEIRLLLQIGTRFDLPVS